MRYTSMPTNGTMMMNSAQRVLTPPLRSRLRNKSPKIQNRHMNQAKKMKNSSKASRNDPLLLNMRTPLSSDGCPPASPGPGHGGDHPTPGGTTYTRTRQREPPGSPSRSRTPHVAA